MSTLTYILGWPLVAALVLAFVPRDFRVVMRGVAILATAISALLAIKMFIFFPGALADADGYRYVQQVPWVESLGISYFVGVDGINVGLVLMGGIVAFAAGWCSWEITDRQRGYYIRLLIMTGAIQGAVASLEMFFFYAFHELALVPTFIMIGVWGRGERKNFATFQITLYLSLGALIALVGLILLYIQSGANTFSIPELTRHIADIPLSVAGQNLIFPLLLFGFGILVSLWPFHTWAPLGYASAPTATARGNSLSRLACCLLIRLRSTSHCRSSWSQSVSGIHTTSSPSRPLSISSRHRPMISHCCCTLARLTNGNPARLTGLCVVTFVQSWLSFHRLLSCKHGGAYRHLVELTSIPIFPSGI